MPEPGDGNASSPTPKQATSHADAVRDMYPVEVMGNGPYYEYMTDETELTDEQAEAFLGHFPQPTGGKHNVHALLTDAYFGGCRGYHP